MHLSALLDEVDSYINRDANLVLQLLSFLLFNATGICLCDENESAVHFAKLEYSVSIKKF